MRHYNFPFTAVLGQDRIKNSLIWNIINPNIGGVLISGEKGTAKSTLARAMASLTNKKIIEIPLSITEDRLVGGINFEKAIKEGKKVLEKGLLHDANNNILYIDEVNLLSDTAVKILLEVAGNGFCSVEREGVSGTYKSKFLLIGSMNPEESGLRPQFLDRFGLYVDVSGEMNLKTRKEIIRRCIAYETNPLEFIHEYEEEEKVIGSQIELAIKRFHSIKTSSQSILLAADLAKQANCEGHRAEIILMETAKAICAYLGIPSVNKESILEAAEYVLPHRAREVNKEEVSKESEKDSQDDFSQNQDSQKDSDLENPQDNQNRQTDTTTNKQTDTTTNNKNLDNENIVESEDPYAVSKWLEQKLKKNVNTGSGKRSIVKTDASIGRYVKSRLQSKNTNDIAFDATVRAAARYQAYRTNSKCKLVIKSQDIRFKVRERRTGNCILFVVDASASMGVGKRMSAVKGAILSLLSDAYQKRDKVGLITFRKDSAELILPITHSVELAKKEIADLPTGGKTPLCKGLEMAHQVMKVHQLKEKDVLPVIVLISDGRATIGYSKRPFDDAIVVGKAITADKIHTVVIDAEQDFIRLGLAERLSIEMQADLYRLDDLRADTLVMAIQHAIN